MYFFVTETNCNVITKPVSKSDRRYSSRKAARENSPEPMTNAFDFARNWLKERETTSLL